MPQTVEIKSPVIHSPDIDDGGSNTQKKDYMQFRCNNRVIPGDQIHEACKNASPTNDKVLPMAAIVQVYNHEKEASLVIQGLASQSNMAKILVYEDGSTDRSMTAYKKATEQIANAQVLDGGNVHEIRNYNKGMETIMADDDSNDIELFALMQDDDVLTAENDDWGPRASELFQRHPSLCVLGGYVGWTHLEGGKLKGLEYYGNEPSYNKKLGQMHSHIPCGQQNFRFVGYIASSPMILRKACVEDLGLLSSMSTEAGEPGILFDVEYSLRAWASDKWTVGLYQTEFTHGVGGHSSLKSQELRQKRLQAGNKARNWLQAHYDGAHLHCNYEHEGSHHLQSKP